MADIYTDENFPGQVTKQLRYLGHDVLMAFQAGQANRNIPDEVVLQFAADENRVLLTQNRKDFIRLYHHGYVEHAGIIVCKQDQDHIAYAQRIHTVLLECQQIKNTLIRVYRSGNYRVDKI